MLLFRTQGLSSLGINTPLAISSGLLSTLFLFSRPAHESTERRCCLEERAYFLYKGSVLASRAFSFPGNSTSSFWLTSHLSFLAASFTMLPDPPRLRLLLYFLTLYVNESTEIRHLSTDRFAVSYRA
jgi:hypothetical protein